MTNKNKERINKEEEIIDEQTIENVSTIGVFDSEGSERPFGGLIRHGTRIVIFIRHFSCGFCQEYLLGLKKQLSIDKLGSKELFIIGCGHWSVIKPYQELLDLPFPVYADNTRKLYDELGMICSLELGDGKDHGHYLTQGITGTLITSVSRAWKMGVGKFFQSGKISQLGGEFIFQDGKCVYAHRMKNTRDHVEPEELEKLILQN